MKELADIDWADALSRLHPVLLHLPVGLIVTLIWLQLISVFKGLREGARGARTGLVSLLMISTPAAAASGWLLNEGAKYPDPVDLHKWLGVGLAFRCVLVGWAHFRDSKAYTPLLWLSALLLGATAHNGGSLTHGDGFLTDPWLKPEEAQEPATLPPVPEAPTADATDSELPQVAADAQPAIDEAQAVPFEEAMSVFEDLCTRCHGKRKQRGGLALHTMEAILTGGDSGPAVVFGDPQASRLLQVLQLPLDHDDHMPPAKKAQPEPEEIALLERWVLTSHAISGVGAGAAVGEDQEPASPAVPSEAPTEQKESAPTEPSADQPADPTEEGKSVESVIPVEPAAGARPSEAPSYLAALARRQIHVQTLAPNSDSLWIDLAAATIANGELPELLGPVSNRVVDLGLARKSLSAGDLTFLGSLPALTKLDLRRLEPQQGEEAAYDLTPLAASKSIRVLNLAGTALAKSAIDALASMQGLRQVSLAGTGLEAQAPALRERRPELLVNLGAVPQDAVEVEPEVKFERLTESE